MHRWIGSNRTLLLRPALGRDWDEGRGSEMQEMDKSEGGPSPPSPPPFRFAIRRVSMRDALRAIVKRSRSAFSPTIASTEDRTPRASNGV